MMLPLHDHLREAVTAAVARLYGPDAAAGLTVPIEYPPNRGLGDLAVPVAFELARRLRRAPRGIAQELATALPSLEGIERVEATASGYVNCFLDRPAFLLARVQEPIGRSQPARSTPHGTDSGKTIVEHTAINPNKAAHIGHLRNAALGDTLVRVLRFRDVPVEVQNYIDDTGVQVADVVVGFRELEGKPLDAIQQLAETTRFDYYCWDLYARVTEWYAADPARLSRRVSTLHDIERGGTEAAAMAAVIADRIVRSHLNTMARLNVDYDLLTWEGDILRLQFWARAFEILKTHGAVFLQTEGELAGCWVMRIDEDVESTVADPSDDEIASPEADENAEAREKVIVRSDGTVTYVGKDIAYQFWKFGLLGADFHYRIFSRRADGRPLWATSASPGGDDVARPRFGSAHTAYNVIDVRQSYLQKLLKQTLATLGYTTQAERSIHFSYEMVALSQATARDLGYLDRAGADQPKRVVEVSGRKGQGVKADDLLDAVIRKATAEVRARNPEFDATEAGRVGSMIGVAAVRYFLIKYSRVKVIAFDIDEALNFEGESGPYLQYAVVRANNIFRKLQEREGLGERAIVAELAATPADELAGAPHELWNLVLEAARLDEVVEQVLRSLEFSILAKYGFALAQAFNAFYHRYPILNEEQQAARRWRAAGVGHFRRQLSRTLDLMGIEVPPRM